MHIGAEQIVKLCDVEQTSSLSVNSLRILPQPPIFVKSSAVGEVSVVGVVTDVIQSCVDSPWILPPFVCFVKSHESDPRRSKKHGTAKAAKHAKGAG